MRSSPKILFVLLLLLQLGCSSQPIQTHRVFEEQGASWQELQDALRDLRPISVDGSTAEQFKAARTLRHIQKFIPDPAKQALAIRELVFLAAYSDNSEVQTLANSRLRTIVSDPKSEILFQTSVINGKRDIITGALAHQIHHSSFFSDEITIETVLPENQAREKALEWLITDFDDLSVFLQYKTIQAFNTIFDLSRSCLIKSEMECRSNEKRLFQNARREIGAASEEWLSKGIPLDIKTRLIDLATRYPSQNHWLRRWKNNQDIESETQKLIQAGIHRTEQIYDLARTPVNKRAQPKTAESGISGASQDKRPFKHQPAYSSLGFSGENTFWFQHADLIIERQLFSTSGNSKNRGTRPSGEKLIPRKWLFDGDKNLLILSQVPANNHSEVLQAIILQSINTGLKKGYRFSIPSGKRTKNALGTEPMMKGFLQSLQAHDIDESTTSLEQTLILLPQLYPLWHSAKHNITPLTDLLQSSAAGTKNRYNRGLFLKALVTAIPFNSGELRKPVCEALKNTDIFNRYNALKILRDSVSPPESTSQTDVDLFDQFCNFEVSWNTVVQKLNPVTPKQSKVSPIPAPKADAEEIYIQTYIEDAQ